MPERSQPPGIPDLCAYPLERATAILRQLAPDARISVVHTRPSPARLQEGPLRVLRQRALDDGIIELLVAPEDGCGPVKGETGSPGMP